MDLITLTVPRGDLLEIMHAVAMEYNRRGREETARIYDDLKVALLKKEEKEK